MPTPDELALRQEAATEMAEEAARILDRVANGQDNEMVEAAGGQTPSILKFLADRNAQIQAAAGANGRWCGAGSMAPATRLDGSALQVGDEYQQTTGDKLRYAWSGIAWVALNSSAQTLEAALATAGGAAKLGAKGGGTVQQALPMVSVVQFGGTGIGEETAALQAACQEAVAAGHKRVFIPFSAFTVANGTNAFGCELYGADTDLTGRIVDHIGMHNIRVMGQNQSDAVIPPAPLNDLSPKLLWQFAATKAYLFVRKVGARGYLMLGFGRNITTGNESLATTTSEPTRDRLVDVLNAVWCGSYVFNISGSNGVWTQGAAPADLAFANLIPPSSSGRALKLRTANQPGDYLEFTTTVVGGKITLALFSGVTATASATVTINGGSAQEIRPRAPANNTFRIFDIDARPYTDGDQVVLRITHNGAAAEPLIVVGVHFKELKDWNGHPADSFAYYRSNTYADYLTQSSANDAVIREYYSNTYGLSYHGGEQNIVSKWMVENQETTLPLDAFVPCRRAVLETSCTVSWAALGGGSVNIASRWTAAEGGISHQAQLHGDVTVRELYTHMFGTPESFTEVLFPVVADMAGMASGSRVAVGRSGRTVVRNPITGQRITSELTLYNREQNQYGGAHFWHVLGSYNKFYYGPCLGGKMRITNLGLVSNHRFD